MALSDRANRVRNRLSQRLSRRFNTQEIFNSCTVEEIDIPEIVEMCVESEADFTVTLPTLITPNSVTIVHTSNTHNLHLSQKGHEPEGDIYMHSGDFSHKRDWKDDTDAIPHTVRQFNEYLGTLPYRIKIVIGGNHEIGFNNLTSEYIQKHILTNAIYLQDKSLRVLLPEHKSLLFYGTPWTTSHNMGFSMSRDTIYEKWEAIPDDTDVLITHLPPQGYLDLASGTTEGACKVCGESNHPYNKHWGEAKLKQRTKYLCEHGRLKLHLFGHVHEECSGVKVKVARTKTIMYYNGSADCGTSQARVPHAITLSL